MNKFLWIFSRQFSPNQLVRSWLLVMALVLFGQPVSITSNAQTTENPPAKGTNVLNSSWDEAKVVLSAPPPPTKPVPILSSAGADPVALLSSARVIYVRSTSLLVGASTVEEKLRGRSEFQQLRLLITRDEPSADLILELRHDVLTKYVYTAIDPKTQVVVASGKVSSLGGTVAGKVAKRFLKQVTRARMQVGPKP